MVDYSVFIGNGISIIHIGDLNNVNSFQEAKSKILKNPNLKNKRYFLLNKKDLIEVNK